LNEPQAGQGAVAASLLQPLQTAVLGYPKAATTQASFSLMSIKVIDYYPDKPAFILLHEAVKIFFNGRARRITGEGKE
jgi:hypothetical protein